MEISDFSTLVQALTGVVALIVSILALLQQKKIKELADITFELKEQTEKLQKQNDILEKINTDLASLASAVLLDLLCIIFQ